MTDPRMESLRRIHSASLAPVSSIAALLLDVLGSRLASMVCDLRDPKALPRYASGKQAPRSESEQRLRAVHQIVSTLASGGLTKLGIQAWFAAINPDLDDQCPAILLKDGKPESQREVLYAARAYAEVYEDLPQPADAPANRKVGHTG